MRRHHNNHGRRSMQNGTHLKPLHRVALALGVPVVVGKPLRPPAPRQK